jgi:hypothetical protein
MKIKHLAVFFLTALFAAVFCFEPGYSASKDGPALMIQVKKAEAAMSKVNPPKKSPDQLEEERMAVVDKCSGEYDACEEKCADVDKPQDYDRCFDVCNEKLAKCEKDLPVGYRTIK